MVAAPKDFGLYIDGAWEAPDGGRVIDSFNPANATVWARFADASERQVDRAVRASREAFEAGDWPKMTGTDRAKILRAIAGLIPQHVENLAITETVDCGKIISETRSFTRFCASYYSFYADLADKIHGETYATLPGFHTHTVRDPLGVVAAIVPWNNQLWLLSLKLAPALATGNTVVVKPSEVSAAPTLEFVALLEDVGLPKGVVNVVTGGGDTCGRALTSHPEINKIAFTGGPEAARHIIRNSASNLAAVSLELGGKSPVLIFPDADLENAVSSICAGVFIGSSGQSCVAGSRVYVHSSVYDKFMALLLAKVATLRVGDPMLAETQMGPLATLRQLEFIEQQLSAALAAGARLEYGGRRKCDVGWYFEPTVVSTDDYKLPIVDTELFGPVLCVMQFKDEAQAVSLVNGTKYGLAAGIFSRDVGRVLRLTRAIRAGIQYVNCYRVAAPVSEIGGFKDSGSSREGGYQALLDYTRSKTVWINTNI